MLTKSNGALIVSPGLWTLNVRILSVV